MKKGTILLRFLLNLDEKIYQLMPRYATKRQKEVCRRIAQKWRKTNILGRFRALIKILFVCHGNICRSPMAEFVMKNLVRQAGLSDSFYIASAATSTEEIGNDIHYGTRRKLQQEGVPFTPRAAVQICRSDYAKYDYLIGMDSANIRNMNRAFGGDPEHKIYKLPYFAGRDDDIADPWYTGNFEDTYRDVLAGCQGLLRHLGGLSRQ